MRSESTFEFENETDFLSLYLADKFQAIVHE